MDNLFWRELHKNIKPFLVKARTKRVTANIILSLHGLDDQIRPARRITQLQEFLSDLLHNYGELVESMKRFKIISILIKQYPKQSSWDNVELNKTVYLRYHYESFLNEAYLYRERMRSLLNDLKRKCRKKSLTDEVKLIDRVIKDFVDALTDVTTIRGYHVHHRRYKNKKIEQLDALELVTGVSPYYSKLRDKEYRKLRIKLSKEIEQFSSDLEKLQNQTLEKIIDFTFNDLKNKYV